MTKTFTPNDIIRYIYNETSLDENFFIEQYITEDDTLHGIYEDFIYLKDKIDKSILSPSESIIKKIISYSESFNSTGI